LKRVFEIQISGTARKQLKRLAPDVRTRIREKIDQLQFDPRPPGFTQLQSADKRFRVRVGDYRIIYKIYDSILVILVLEVGYRGSAYR
jgi:mRNA interferase RelE/StbE